MSLFATLYEKISSKCIAKILVNSQSQ